ncbi:cysteine hydrolase [Halomicroarcula sp. GCM10025709]|uniref:cysteine hydrolase family protein n=1 Tax=Haloarcula TaxID=2237 RepID=UPI0024C43B1F|nr:cysteine hydrolase [Halomicroarcula sp. YJ-61-S]
MDPETTAVLTVDLHRGHLDPEIATLPVPADRAEEIVDASERLVTAARANDFPVIHVTTAYRDASEITSNPKWNETEVSDGDSREAISEHNVYGNTEGMEIMPALAADEDTFLQPKKRYSPFLETDLPFVLRVNDIETLVVAGVNTNTCVQCTCFEATNRDYEVVVVEDCVGSMDGEEFHQLGLKNIDQALGTVESLDQVTESFEN